MHTFLFGVCKLHLEDCTLASKQSIFVDIAFKTFLTQFILVIKINMVSFVNMVIILFYLMVLFTNRFIFVRKTHSNTKPNDFVFQIIRVGCRGDILEIRSCGLVLVQGIPNVFHCILIRQLQI